MNIVEIKDLSFKYPEDKKRAGFELKVPELSLARGSSLALFGASGAGKSTLLAICASLQKGFAGSVKLFGTQLSNDRRGADGEAVSRMAILFQDAPLFNCCVYENISIGLQIRKTPRAEIKRRVDEMIEKLNISGIAYADAREISGGQAKRVCLARLLVLKPELLFLDEPFYSLDAINRSQIMHELKRLSAEAAIALMLVTHDKNEALALCENLAVMDAGAIIRYGDIKSCFNNPKSETEARLLGRNMVFYGQVTVCSDEVAEIECVTENESAPLTFQAAADYKKGDRVCLMISPQDLSVSPYEGGGGKSQASSALNCFEGEIVSAAHYEFGMLLNISTGGGFVFQAYITSRSYESLGLGPEKKVKFFIKATAVKSFLMP